MGHGRPRYARFVFSNVLNKVLIVFGGAYKAFVGERK
jgi:hypothetical protein